MTSGAGPDPTRLKYILYNNALFYLTANPIPGILSPALVGHAKAEGAIATGAAFYLETPAYGVDTPLVEGFSSKGGVANYYDISGNRIPPLVRQKPEIVAPDGANTSFFDPFGNGDISEDKDTLPNFFGTSAAAPHAAGVAALMIDAQKLHTLKPGQIKGILSSHAVDMDDPYTTGFDNGFDFTTGAGLIVADNTLAGGDVVGSLVEVERCQADAGIAEKDHVLVALAENGTIDVRKVVTTPADPTFGLFKALDALASLPIDVLIHGTTIATNALLERLDPLYGPRPGHPAKPVVMVLDNGPIHTSRLSRAALAERPWLTIEWLPKYAPELNDIERSWRDLKRHFLAHRTFKSIEQLDSAVATAVDNLNLERNKHSCHEQRIAA